MLGKDYAGQNCSVARSLELVGERWTLLIIRDALLGVTRFEHFQDRLKIAPNILSKRLRTLVDAGVMERRRYQERPERHEYALTEAGKELLPVVLSLARWGDAHLAPNGPPVVARHAACGGSARGDGPVRDVRRDDRRRRRGVARRPGVVTAAGADPAAADAGSLLGVPQQGAAAKTHMRDATRRATGRARRSTASAPSGAPANSPS